MTYEDRERIFAKEYLDTDDIMTLFGGDRRSSSDIISRIKWNTEDRLRKKGKVHIQDYFDYFKLDPANYRPNMSQTVIRHMSEIAVSDIFGVQKNQVAVEIINGEILKEKR